MNASPGTVAAPTILVNINGIRCRKLPTDGIKHWDKFYVELVVDGESEHKTGTSKGDTALWTESFHFNALSSSILECRVYTKHNIRNDEFIGGTKDRIESLLAEGADGAITRELCKSDSSGILRKTQVVIEFTIAAMSKASHAAGLNMEEAVAQGRDAVVHMELAPSSFKPIRGAAHTSVAAVANIKSLTTTLNPLLQKLDLFTKLVDRIAQVHPYANMAWSVLSCITKTILAQVDRDSAIIGLVEIMDDVFSFVKEAEPIKKIESHGRIIELMVRQTTECAYFIRDYATNKGFWERTFKNSFLSNVESNIKRYEDKFKELKSAFHDRAVLQTEIIVSRIFDNLDTLATDVDFHDMPYANGARFDPDKGCQPGTRYTIIEEIIQWVNSPNEDDVRRIFLLSGVAGYGKSAIAHTIAKLFDVQKRLGSSYCFDRADQANRRPNNLLSTIALDIADLDSHWKSSLGSIVKGNRSLRTTLSVTEQFKKFILEPATALATVGPILLVIDALDESAEGPYRKALLATLANGISDLPSNFRILITTRPEPDIVGVFAGNPHILCKYMNTIDETSNKADISLFVGTQLSDVRGLELEWPNKRWCQMLVESSGGLFQWASAACQAIKDSRGVLSPTERLSRFVSSARGLDALYSEILRQAFDGQDDDAMSLFKLVMGRVLATKEPLSISAHSELRGPGEAAELTGQILPLLGSLLSGVDQLYIPIRPLHASFFDFLSEQSRSKTYFVDPSHANRSITLSSLRVMKSGLRFNIGDLETSHCRNTDVPDLPSRIEKAILPHLSYGCRFWTDHLRSSVYGTDILDGVKEFFDHRFLYWLEVLSLLKKFNMATGMLRLVLDWNQESTNDVRVASFTNDAIKFVSVFGPPISQSTPHLYISALPFAPKNSLVAKQYLPQFAKTLHLKTGKADDWPAIIAVLEGHFAGVSSVAFSHDGRLIISASGDQTIRVWDAETGEVVVEPLIGHTSGVYSVAISQDGKRIVSGSWDQTIRVWDEKTGEVVVGPLEGHTEPVNSVAFSQDGKRIVSGSGDRTVRVWDAETGVVVVGPLRGHTSLVGSVAFSQDSKRIVSGSADSTIRVWDAETGEVVIGPLEGHNLGVASVAFSQDGKRIVSGSYDQTIRMWDAETGDVVGLLEGHTGFVYSVAFSQDSKRIVSGSADNTIRVWDAETREVVVEPLTGHTGGVTSVAFSQDGKRIVSGSDDHTIRVWDAETREAVVRPLEGHASFVHSVAISQDSKRIISGSWDQTIRVWDAETGDAVVGPLEGHTSFVHSVAISQDGRRIASGSRDLTIRVWDAETGQVVVGPLEGHTEPVSSIAFSQDCKRLVSGSEDQTIQVWDAETGVVVVGPLKGHTGFVNSVAFSQDSKRIVSGSADNTIRVWDAETGGVVIGPLEGHTEPVSSIAFSQDGKQIVSGSEDQTIRVWDAETGGVVGLLEGHTESVNSVAFSQDSKRIVSGSADNTIRVWDTETGEVVVGPLEGHNLGVASVTFSHNDKRIVSGSYDQTIRMWDAETGDVVAGLLERHPESVHSLAISQDSNHIVSDPRNQTIRVWDAESRGIVRPIGGHTMVTILQDGQHIGSGSENLTTHIFPVHTINLETSFSDTSILDAGWIQNSPSQLLFWVPSWNRPGLCWPRNRFVISLYSPSTCLDLHEFMHASGDSWQQCRSLTNTLS